MLRIEHFTLIMKGENRILAQKCLISRCTRYSVEVHVPTWLVNTGSYGTTLYFSGGTVRYRTVLYVTLLEICLSKF
jgi:hypothetical protein